MTSSHAPYPDGKVPYNREDPLARVPRESKKANQGLRDYAYMRAGRSLRVLLARYQQMKKNWVVGQPVPPTTSFDTMGGWSRWFAWQERVKLFDEGLLLEDELAFKREQEEWRKRRRTLLRVAHGKIGNALNSVNVTNPRLAEVVRALEVLAEQSRIEYGDMPGMEVEDQSGGKVVIKQTNIIPQSPPDLSDLDEDEGTVPD